MYIITNLKQLNSGMSKANGLFSITKPNLMQKKILKY